MSRVEGWVKRKAQGLGEPWNKKPCPDIIELRRLYLVEKIGSHAIAKQFYGNQRIILRWLKEAGVKIRTHAEANKITAKESGFQKGNRHWRWEGDDVGYAALHTWVKTRLGKPKKCSYCKTTSAKKYEWASIGHAYKRELKS